MLKVIVAHEGKQHSFRTAEALLQKGYLFKYITTIYDKPFSLTRIVKHILRGDAKKKCASHRTDAIPDGMVLQYCEWKGLLRLFLSKFPALYKHFPHYYDWLHDSFGKKVAEYAIKNNVDAVIMYDTNANECWRILKERAPQIKRILDVTIASRIYTEKIFRNDSEKFADSKIIEEAVYLQDDTELKRNKEELISSDYFLVGSTFVKNSLLYSGIEDNQIIINPYGVNINQFSAKSQYQTTNPLRLIFVGAVCYRKGIHHLLSVVSKYSKDEVILNLVGGFPQDSEYYIKYKDCDNIHFCGFVTHDVLAEYYNNTDVFVLPSLSEGFAQVSLEAMSCGLPVICTTNSGCNDAIKDFETGFVIEPSNREQLKEKIDWFIQNRSCIEAMGKKARLVSLDYTWESYYEKLTNTIEKLSNNNQQKVGLES